MSNGMQRKWYEGPWVFIAGGCCLGCLIIPLACVAVVGTGGLMAISKNPVAKMALEVANESTRVDAELGTPVKYHWFGTETQMNFNNRGADIAVGLSGRKAEGHLSGHARKVDGRWIFDRLRVRLDDGRLIDLLSDEIVPDDVEYEQLPLGDSDDAPAFSAESASDSAEAAAEPTAEPTASSPD